MRAGETGRHQQVLALALAGDDAAVGDRIGREAAGLHVALVDDAAVLHHALDVVRVHRVGGQGDAVLGDRLAATVMLRHHHLGDHAPPLADVKLVRPAVGFHEFVPRQAPLVVAVPHGLGHARVDAEKPHQARLVLKVLVEDAVAGVPVAFGPVVVHPDVVGGDGAVVVGVRFAVGHRHRVVERDGRARLVVAGQQRVVVGIVTSRAGPGDLVGRVLRHAHPEAVGLDAAVSRPVRRRLVGRDALQQAAGGIALPHIGIDGRLKLMEGPVELRAVERLAVLGVRLPPHGIGNARHRQQVALVRGVDEHPGAEAVAPMRDDLADALVPLADLLQPLLEEYGHAGLGRHLQVEVLGNVRLEAVAVAAGGELCGIRPVDLQIVRPDAAVELS